MWRQHQQLEDYEVLLQASRINDIRLCRSRRTGVGIGLLAGGSAVVLLYQQKIVTSILELQLDAGTSSAVAMVLAALGGALLLSGVCKLLQAWRTRLPPGLEEKLSTISADQARLLGARGGGARGAEIPHATLGVPGGSASKDQERDTRWDNAIPTPEVLRTASGPGGSSSLRYRSQYAKAGPTLGTPGSAGHGRSAAAAAQRALSYDTNDVPKLMEDYNAATREAAAQHMQQGPQASYPGAREWSSGAGGYASYAPPAGMTRERSEGYVMGGGGQVGPVTPVSTFKVYDPRAMLGTGGAYDGRGQLSPRTLAAQTAALQRVLREQGLERGFSGIVDATRRYLAVLLRDRYARPLRWAAEELARKGVDPDVAKQIQLRQARFRLPGSADWLRNVTLKDIIYKSLERCRAAFDCQDPATGAPVNLLDLYQDLERVLLVSADPGYVYERLQQLAADAQLGGVRWDGGGAHAGAPWSPALPTDAELVMHVFVCRCNELLARTPAERLDGAPFASRFYDEVPAAALDPGRYRSRVVLVRTDVRGGGGGAGGGGGNGGGAPHYQVVAGGEVWTVPAGRLNVFQAIALFLWAVKRFKSGYLGDVNLRHEVLDDVFIESPAVG